MRKQSFSKEVHKKSMIRTNSISLKIIHTDRFFLFKVKLKKVLDLIFGFNKVWEENFHKEHTTGLLYATVNTRLAWMSCTGHLRLVHVICRWTSNPVSLKVDLFEIETGIRVLYDLSIFRLSNWLSLLGEELCIEK